MDLQERQAIAERRLISVLARHVAATARTLEQKISDAGPFNQRIDPHILTPVRNRMIEEGQIVRIKKHGRDWFALAEMDDSQVQARIDEQFDVLRVTLDNAFHKRMGDALEIAVFRALRGAQINSLGGFRNLADEPTTGPAKKEEPPSIFNGQELQGNKRFDFLVGTGSWAGVECKNIREWLYPDRPEIKNMLTKAVELNIPPILIGRRIPFVTRRLLQPAGVILWETRGQLYAPEHANIAAQMKEKTSLGFFDIKVSDYPDALLTDFISRIIPEDLPAAHDSFGQYKDLLAEYAYGRMGYREFSARIRRRQQGLNEDRDDDEPEPDGEDDFG